MYISNVIVFSNTKTGKKIFGNVLVSDVFENNNTFKACVMVEINISLRGFEFDYKCDDIEVIEELSKCDSVMFNSLEFGRSSVITFDNITIDSDYCISNCARVYLLSENDMADNVVSNSFINENGQIEDA